CSPPRNGTSPACRRSAISATRLSFSVVFDIGADYYFAVKQKVGSVGSQQTTGHWLVASARGPTAGLTAAGTPTSRCVAGAVPVTEAPFRSASGRAARPDRRRGGAR